MKNIFIKYRFNMIEILLALVVMAIGISSVLALFCSGLKTAKDSRWDDNITEISSYILSEIEARLMSTGWVYYDEITNKYIDIETKYPESFWKECHSNLYKDVTKDGKKSVVADIKNEFEFYPNTFAKSFCDAAGQYDNFIDVKYSNFVYQKYTILPDNSVNTDFSVAVRIGIPRLDKDSRNELSVPGVLENVIPDLYKRCEEKKYFYKILLVELSWPADLEYNQRNHRVYRLELFNNKYTI